MSGVPKEHDEQGDERADGSHAREPQPDHRGFPLLQLVTLIIVGTMALVFDANTSNVGGILSLVGGVGLILAALRGISRKTSVRAAARRVHTFRRA